MGKERETLDVDVLFVGAGPASLAGAYHLARLVKAHDEDVSNGKKQGKKLGPLSIAVIEKGAEIGSHGLSGAVLDPKSLKELVPNYLEAGAPLESEVTSDELYFLTRGSKIRAPFLPPILRNKGKYVVSLNKLVKWMGARCEEAGVDLFPGFPGVAALFDGDTVIGVRTGDKGIDKEGHEKGNYEPGVDIHAKVTVLGEGPRGTITKSLMPRLGLDRHSAPMVYAVGVKEVWELPKGSVAAGRVIHTMGFPHDPRTYGGGFIYGMQDDLLIVGQVTGLDYADPKTDPHHELQLYKTHPFVAGLLRDARLVRYGAKAIPESGYYSMPELYANGLLLVGDSAAMLNSLRLKGIHLAIKSGMLAAETILDALVAEDFSIRTLQSYERRVRSSYIETELYDVRNFHQWFDQGLYYALVRGGLHIALGGGGEKKQAIHAGHSRLKKTAQYDSAKFKTPADAAAFARGDGRDKYAELKYDNKLTFDKLTSVYHAGVQHEEDQPCHLRVADLGVCATKCAVEYGNPCQHFCPANVYEMVEGDGGGKRLQINFSNCVHCKTCDIEDPYQIITWVPPEGGGGPDYSSM